MKKYIFTLGLIVLSINLAFCQWWTTGNAVGPFNKFGSTNNFPVNIYTNNTQKGQWTVSSGIPSGLFGAGGDGLRIYPNTPGSFPLGYLDLWTSTSPGAANETHIKWDGSGQIGGSGAWFRAWSSALNGFEYNLTQASGRHIFKRQGFETARNGVNNYWKIGPVLFGDANRRLEVAENVPNNPQLRISLTTGAAYRWTDFITTPAGHLRIVPINGRTGLNLAAGNPTHTIDVNGDARIRNVIDDLSPNFLLLGNPTGPVNDIEVQKLAFSGNPSETLLGNGTWGTLPNTGIGNYCGSTPNPLTGDYEIPFANFNIYYPGQGTATTNAIGVGYNCTSPMPAKFNVIQEVGTAVTVNTIAGSFINRDFVASGPGSLKRIAVNGISDHIQGSNAFNIGGEFIAKNSPNNYGVRGYAGNTSVLPGVSIGGYFEATSSNSQTNYGVYGVANNAFGNNYAVYGKSLPGSGSTPPTPPNYAGYFDGDVYISGSFGPSDINLKENIDTIADAITIINQLQPKKFNFKNTAYPSMNLPQGLQYGLIAQDVELILPELVSDNIHPAQYDSLGVLINPAVNFKGLEYQQIIPILVKGIKEQQNTINDLNTRLSNLENCINALNLCDGSHTMQNNTVNNENAQDVELKDLQSVILDQNVPNPFAEQTIISYTLVEGTQKAQLLFYNAEGKLINSVDLQIKSGKGQVNVFANDLSNGIYTYTLVVDGKIIDTKRMVKNK